MRSAVMDGDKLCRVREDRELSVLALASLLSQELGRKVSHTTIYRLESSQRQPSARMFGAICRMLRCDKADLLATADRASV